MYWAKEHSGEHCSASLWKDNSFQCSRGKLQAIHVLRSDCWWSLIQVHRPCMNKRPNKPVMDFQDFVAIQRVLPIPLPQIFLFHRLLSGHIEQLCCLLELIVPFLLRAGIVNNSGLKKMLFHDRLHLPAPLPAPPITNTIYSDSANLGINHSGPLGRILVLLSPKSRGEHVLD